MSSTMFDADRHDHLKIVVSAAVFSAVFAIVGITAGQRPMEPTNVPAVPAAKDLIEIEAPAKTTTHGIAIAMSNETRNAIR